MRVMNKVIAAVFVTAAIAPAGWVLAADEYVPGDIYVAGDQTCYGADLYRAKWWAGPDDHPLDVDTVAQPWETPWERVSIASAECSGTAGNRPPIVSASATTAPVDPTGSTPVALIVDASDADGDDLSYSWEQVHNDAPSVAITDAEMANATVLLPEAIQQVTYVFRIRVSDGTESVADEVSITLNPVAGNNAPIAAASTLVSEITGAGSVQLSALGSSDPDGDALTYQWVQVSPVSPRATIDDPTSVQPVVTLTDPSSDTSYVFEVHVSDGVLTDDAQVSIKQRVQGETVACPLWDSSTIYVEGNVVSHDSQTWLAHWWTQGEMPGTTGEWGVWRPAGEASCSGGSKPGTDVVKLSDLLAVEAALTSGELMGKVKASIATLDNGVVEAIAPGDPANPANVKRAEAIVSEADWDYLFARRAPEYTYANFLKAIGKFPAFCGDYTDTRDAEAICRKALATMFAHFTQETGGHTVAWPEPQWRQGLVYLRELGWSEDMANGYGLCDPATWQGDTWPCAVFPLGHPSEGQYKSYFGRGAKQLSYNYNYGPFSEAMYDDVNVLLEQPNLVADTWLNMASAVFFYVYPQPPKPSMLHALDGTWVPNQHDLDNGLEPGFGVTTQIINGGIECGGAVEHQQSQNRIDYYLNFADYLDVTVPPHEVLGCANMQRFDTRGAGALAIYWEQDWGQPDACKLVNYQTPFSAFKEGDYVKCVEYHFDVQIDYES